MTKLLNTWRLIRSSDFATAIFLIVLVFTVGTLGISLFELGKNEQFSSIGSSLWWSIVTSTTVGYGDKVPITMGGKIFGAFLMLAGIASFSLFTAAVSSMLVARKIREGKGLEEIKASGHILICGWNYSGETILDSYKSFSSELDKMDIVLVNNLAEDIASDILYKYKSINVKFVKGDYTSESVLARANAKNANSAIILPDLTSPTRSTADERTVLAILSLKSIAPKIRVYAHTLEKESAAHLKRANATDIVVSDEFSGFLMMTHVLFPGIPQVIKDILNPDSGHVVKKIPIPESFKAKPFSELYDHMKTTDNHTVIALVNEEESVKVSDILVGDYSFLDEFIERKFREAGRGDLGQEQIKLKINPPGDYEIKDEKFAITISHVD